MKNLIKICFFAILFLTLGSCSMYKYNSSRVTSVLAVTAEGDTVQVPISDIASKLNTYQDWNFRWNNAWYPYQTFPYHFYRDYRLWYPQIYYTVPRSRVYINRRRNEINANPIRGNKPPQGRSNGGRSWSREVVPSQPTRPRITPPSQPGQIRRGSQPPRVQQPGPGRQPSRQGSRRPIQQ